MQSFLFKVCGNLNISDFSCYLKEKFIGITYWVLAEVFLLGITYTVASCWRADRIALTKMAAAYFYKDTHSIILEV